MEIHEKSFRNKANENIQNVSEQKVNIELAQRLLPEKLPNIESMLQRYPERNLPREAMVTRIAPSPTGFMHIGGLYMALISERFARQTNGIYYLRIEDTDKKREVQGARKIIVESLHEYNLDPDEGETMNGTEKGAYGPYKQSERKEIYKAFVKNLIEAGRAYPCFCTEEELEKMRKMQEEVKTRPGYYGVWAKCRDVSKKDIKNMLDQKKPYVIRFKSQGKNSKTFIHKDLIKGEIELPENDVDIVILKSDKLPTYHFAHAIDDHLMGTTHVLRGDEWLSSVPLHYELFRSLGFKHPEYGHIAPINKIDNSGGKRKLSKRKDPEANVLFYEEIGYPETAVIEYLMNIANSDFEDWRKKYPNKSIDDFRLSFDKLPNTAGPIFDKNKLQSISKEIIAQINAIDLYDAILKWTTKFDSKFEEELKDNPDYWIKVFSIERGGNQPRKDISVWSEVKEVFSFFIKKEFKKPDWSSFKSILNKNEVNSVLKKYMKIYDAADKSDEWLNKVRALSAEFGFAPNTKTYKENKNIYRGHIGEITQIIRYAITGRLQSPDLYQTMQSLGTDECKKRLNL